MAWLGRGAGEQAPETPKIDSDVFGQSEASSGGFHTAVCARREAVREAIQGVPFGGDRSQGPRHHWPLHQPAFQCKEGEQTLKSFGENQEETFDVQPDPPRSERRGRRPVSFLRGASSPHPPGRSITNSSKAT
jgi:hypothetical protein